MSTTLGTGPDRTRIGRHSIHDRDGAVVGYELLFTSGQGTDGAGPRARDLATSDVICTDVGQFGLDRLGARRNLYVSMTRALLTGELPMPFGPYHVVLEVRLRG
jgi:c-di-GMP-related signal transduction protein